MICKFLFFLFISMTTLGYAKPLSLEIYLQEVKEKNKNILSSLKTLEGLEDRQDESKLLFRPFVFAQGQMAIDKKPTTNINAQGDRTDNSFASIGLINQFDFGLQGKLAYTLAHTKVYNALPTFLPLSDFHDAQLSLELSHPLWRNSNGLEIKAQKKIMDSEVNAKKYTEQYKIKIILSNAELTYWSLAQMQKMLLVQKENLERAIKIRKWANDRANNGLGDRSDFLQADANVKYRDFELETTEQQIKNLQRTFNSFRENNTDIVNESLIHVSSEKIRAITLPKKSHLRDDIKAAIQYQKLNEQNLQISIERNKPNLELYGSYALNGRNQEKIDSISNGFKTNNTTTAIGIRFSAPLDFSNLQKNIQGYQKEQQSLDLAINQKIFDQEKEWNDMASKFEEAKRNLITIEKLELAQKLKSINERERLTRGRTTTFQALNFEQDYAQSIILKIKSELEILNLYSQSKAFISDENTSKHAGELNEYR